MLMGDARSFIKTIVEFFCLFLVCTTASVHCALTPRCPLKFTEKVSEVHMKTRFQVTISTSKDKSVLAFSTCLLAADKFKS